MLTIMNGNSLRTLNEQESLAYTYCKEQNYNYQDSKNEEMRVQDFYSNINLSSPTVAEFMDPKFDLEKNYPKFYVQYSFFKKVRECYCKFENQITFLVSNEHQEYCKSIIEEKRTKEIPTNRYDVLWIGVSNEILILLMMLIWRIVPFFSETNYKTMVLISSVVCLVLNSLVSCPLT